MSMRVREILLCAVFAAHFLIAGGVSVWAQGAANPAADTSAAMRPDIPAMIQAANILDIAGKFTEADRAYKSALATAETTFGPNSGSTAYVLSWQAAFFSKYGMLWPAWETAERSLTIHREVLGRFDPRTLNLHVMQGSIAVLQKRASAAEQQFRLLLEAYDLSSDEKADAVSGAYAASELGNLLFSRGNNAEAERAWKKSIAYREKNNAPE